jgi:molecular chaperone GrpE
MANHEELAKKAEEKENVQPSPSEDEAEAASALESAAPAGDLAAACAKLEAEKQLLYDRLLRKQAELDNFRKRAQREKEEFRDYAAEDLIRSLLPTLDGFERALKHRDANVPEPFYQGMEMIHRELLEVLKRAGLVALETLGKTFDPHYHQAVETVEAADRRDHEIVEELQRGYKLRHRLLRPAIVKVAVAPSKAQAPAGSQEPAENE